MHISTKPLTSLNLKTIPRFRKPLPLPLLLPSNQQIIIVINLHNIIVLLLILSDFLLKVFILVRDFLPELPPLLPLLHFQLLFMLDNPVRDFIFIVLGLGTEFILGGPCIFEIVILRFEISPLVALIVPSYLDIR